MSRPSPQRRAEILRQIAATAKGELASEISFHCDGIDGRDYPFDALSALFDIEERAEEDGPRSLLIAARRLLIQLGFYRWMPPEEQAQTTVSRGTVWAFKLGGVAYTSDELVSEWQFPEGEEA